MTKYEVLNLTKKVKELKKGKENILPCSSYFLDKDEILCYPRAVGDSRYPYYKDGLVLFVHSDGYMDCVEGDFNIFKCAHYNEDANIAFFAGEKLNDYFFPISITGAAQQLFEENVNRYTVFTPACAYYIAETPKAIYATRVYVDDNKHICFSVGAVNLAEEREIYLCAYFEPMLRDSPVESFFSRMNKYGRITENGGYVIRNVRAKDYCLAVRNAVEGNVIDKYQTAAKNDFVCNKGGNLTNAKILKTGRMESIHQKVNTTELPVVCDMIHFTLSEDGFAQISYEMAFTVGEDNATVFANGVYDLDREEKELSEMRFADRQAFSGIDITFDDWDNEKIHSEVLNNFLGCIRRQISLCALGKNYAGEFLGIRDVFQQLELSLIWQKDASRIQMVRVMDYILEDGRPPRQITLSAAQGQIPKMDLRPFIDQGFWIVSTFHTYLSYTDDLSILNEVCGYYKAESTYGPLSRSEDRDTVLDHLIRIMKFLTSNIDADTGCVHALFGDWNDALDGLGKTKDKTKEFGNGVSVMATLQMYLSFTHMIEILERVGENSALIDEYKRLQAVVAEGLAKYAIVKNADGVARMAHGWGDNREYYVGSYNDYDGNSRISLTSNAFFAISGLVDKFPECKEDIVNNILSLDTRFGLLTFDKPFTPYASEVGRISNITPGTYENACTYVHAGTFGVMALFLMGHPKEAWDILQKAMVISHDNVTMSTFVMPNSYCIDGEFDFDGESMGDWYTGSGAVLMKNVIKYGFGVEPTMDAVKIMPSAYFPAKSAQMKLVISGKSVTVRYENRGQGIRQILMNGEPLELRFDKLRNAYGAVVSKSKITENSDVLIID